MHRNPFSSASRFLLLAAGPAALRKLSLQVSSFPFCRETRLQFLSTTLTLAQQRFMFGGRRLPHPPRQILELPKERTGFEDLTSTREDDIGPIGVEL